MKEEIKLTPEQLESFKTILYVYAKAYFDITGNLLKSVGEIIEIIESQQITMEDVYANHLDRCFPHGRLEREEDIFLDDHLTDMFSYENYLPSLAGKDIGSGCWVKVRNENGFEVHFAKPTNRKRRFNEELESLMNKLSKSLQSNTKELEDINTRNNALDNADKYNKYQKALREKIYETTLRIHIDLKPYEVRIVKSKTKTIYLLPYQYEILEDIDDFSNAYMQDTEGVEMKSIFTSEQTEIIFYLTSRGISKKTAQVMAMLGQSYFVVNMNTALAAFNTQWNKTMSQLVS